MKAGDLIWSRQTHSNLSVFDHPFLIVNIDELDVKILNLENSEVFFLTKRILRDLLEDEMIQLEKS